MTPRIEVDWIDIAADADAVRAKLLETPHTRLPVARGSVDDIVGVVQARDIAGALFRGEALDLEMLTRRAAVLHDQIEAMDAREGLSAAAATSSEERRVGKEGVRTWQSWWSTEQHNKRIHHSNI